MSVAEPSQRPLRFDEVGVGSPLPPLEVAVNREVLVRYAGASGDFNPIHWSDHHASELGLPTVVAHGLLTMGQAATYLTRWAGDPAVLEEFAVRFVKPVAVPAGETVLVHLSGEVTEALEGGRVRVTLTVTAGGEKVLGRATALLRLAPTP